MFTSIYTFPDGYEPEAVLVQSTNWYLYGTSARE
jgi:hypothetical protein